MNWITGYYYSLFVQITMNAADEDQPWSDNLTTTYHGLGINDFNLKYGHKTADTNFSFRKLMKSSPHAVNGWRRGLLTFVERRIPAVQVFHKYKVSLALMRNGTVKSVAKE